MTGNRTVSLLKDIGIIAFLILFPHLVPLPFYSYAIVCFLLIWFRLRREGKTFRDLGLTKNGLRPRMVLIGIGSALIWVGFMQLVYIPVIKHLFVVPDYTEYNFIRSSVTTLVTIIAAACLIGGFYEEVVFRGYIWALVEKWFPPRVSLIPVALIFSSLSFGLYHWQQDVFGMVAAFLGGLFWGMLYKRFKNLWVVMLSHAFFDTVTLLLIYTDIFGKVC